MSAETAASCTCLTKTPDIEYHDERCVYRLITERNAALEKLHIANLRLAIADPDGETISMTHDENGNEISYG